MCLFGPGRSQEGRVKDNGGTIVHLRALRMMHGNSPMTRSKIPHSIAQAISAGKTRWSEIIFAEP
ncbi:MAG: hypothetical protein EA401_08550 [Planctomycetota bacterium]|nr:MAG: hypothetical protein EA401_08550 [Planctomycetota bacterium]